MKNIILEMAALKKSEQPFVLATVISRKGSAPRSAGARMLVREDGSTLGTVGGGILEARVEQLAKEVIQSHHATVQEFVFSGKDAASMDAICGGQVEVLVEWLDPADPHTGRIIQELQTVVEQRRRSWLVTTVSDRGKNTHHTLVNQDRQVLGQLPHTLTVESVIATRQSALISLDLQQVLIEPINVEGTTYIFGAGHVSRSLAEFTRAVGFWTVVLDDRPEYTTLRRFPTADELIVLDAYENILEKIQIDRDSFIVIVTRGHLDDFKVLAQILQSNAGYIGMIGSRRKCELIFEELCKLGFTQADLQRVHAPIGIAIDAETPEEIGISIVAEMIQNRAKLRRNQAE
jgi:xanthine dehydrogenase accessory factor